MKLTLAAYNFLSGGSASRSGHWTRLLRRSPRPSLIFTQESRPPESKLPAGDTLYWRSVPGYRWGSGILVRGIPSLETAVLGFEGWVIGAEFDLAKTVRAYSVHCPARDRGYVRSMHALLDAIAPSTGDADLILAGDFNVAAGVRGPSETVKFSRGERELLDRLDQDFGLVPSWQSHHPNKPLVQTLRWTANRTAPYHCDGVFIPRSWLPQLASCDVLDDPTWRQLSDHNPVIARLRMHDAVQAEVLNG